MISIADAVAFLKKQHVARLKELIDSGVEYNEALRQVYYPGFTKEEHTEWYKQYEAAYNGQFVTKEKK